MGEDQEFEEAGHGLDILLDTSRSVVLATASGEGAPFASYAPVYVDNQRALYVYVSRLAKHYAYLSRQKRASAMFIEDEKTAENLFARKRLTLDCAATLIERDSVEWSDMMDLMTERLGDTMAYLRGMTDFDLFRLEAKSGRLVLGFGKAYQVGGVGLNEIGYVKSSGHK